MAGLRFTSRLFSSETLIAACECLMIAAADACKRRTLPCPSACLQDQPQPQRVRHGLDGQCVVGVACGDDCTAAVTDTGALYMWGRLHMDSRPQLVPLHVRGDLAGQRVVQVKVLAACLHADRLACCASALRAAACCLPAHPCRYHPAGLCFVASTQAGRAHLRRWSLPTARLARQIATLATANSLCLQVSCGPFHCAAVSADGRLFTWGEGFGGKLGHGDQGNRSQPALVQALAGRQVRVPNGMVLHPVVQFCCATALPQQAVSGRH